MSPHEETDQLQIPDELPVLPVRDLVIFPDMIAPLFVHRPASIAAVERALDGQRLLLVVAQRSPQVEAPAVEDLYAVGTVGQVVRLHRLDDGRIKLLLQGLRKARVENVLQQQPHLLARLRPIVDLPLEELSTETEAMMRSLREQLRDYGRVQGSPGPDVIGALEGITDPGRLADLCASHMQLAVEAAQLILATPDPIKRLRTVLEHLAREHDLLATKAHIDRQVRAGMDKTQRDFYLREQMKQIRSELGEGGEDDIDELEQRLSASRMPPAVRAEAGKQLQRLARMHPESAEAGTLRTYLEWLLDMPWQQCDAETLDLGRAKSILDADHLGLDAVKDRVLEHLAVRKLNPDSPPPVMCLIGPPGVGKTSLGRSVARALGRKFVRLSLGGVRDEAEIRGHRRTYVGAMPGRLIQAVKQAGALNPVIALDEIDKLGRDMRGDPAAALLEVLDPEQSHGFVDHYLNVPFDLGQVLFITTGNRTDTIPPALLDRMELIPVPGYALEEKLPIARRHLVPRQRQRCGLQPEQFALPDASLQLLVERYTHESGLRQLEQAVARLARRAARRVAEGAPGPARIEPPAVIELLGPPERHPLAIAGRDAIGTANGLAWTPAGGEVLQVEATAMAGRGQLILTGQLGGVMKESAQAALSFTRSLENRPADSPGPFAEQDIHIHIPAGAIPKDGPSAGVAMVVVLVSLLSRIAVCGRVGMTGEISLRGRVLAVGGLREKLLAARRAGLERVIVPAANREEIDALPADLAAGMEIVTVDTVEQALDRALAASPFEASAPAQRAGLDPGATSPNSQPPVA
jgi:ATP-dependent Lon protease